MSLTRNQRDALLFGLVAVAIIYMVFRGHSDTIVLREWINPDEGDLLASGRRAALSLVPFKDFTSFTYGPMWPFTLGWLHRVGVPLTLPMGHVLNATIVSGCCIALARVIWRRWNPVFAVVVVAPIAIHWTKGFYSQDFYSLSTESLGLVWLVAGSAVAFPRGVVSARRAFVGAALFGCVLWTKYSFGPVIAVALLAVVIKMVSSGHSWSRSLKTVVAAPLAPYGFLATWAVLMGVPLWKVVETLDITLRYLRGGGLEKTSPTLGHRVSDTWHALSMFRTVLPLVLLLTVTLVVGAMHQGFDRKALTHPAQLTRALAVGAVASSCAALLVLVPIYPHYTNLFVGGLILATFLVASLPPVATESRGHFAQWLLAGTIAVAAWSLPPVLQRGEIPLYRWTRGDAAKTRFSKSFTTDGGLWDRIVTANGAPLSQVCPRRSRVLVWGWSPDLYSQYDWVPATRYVITTSLMVGADFNSNIARFRPRLLEEIRRRPPTCIVDGASDALYPSWGSENSIEAQWPEFVADISSAYTKVPALVYGTTPVTIWVANR